MIKLFLKKSMGTESLALVLSRGIKHFTNLWYFCESICECTESVIPRCSKKMYNPGQNIQRLFQALAQLPLTTTESELGYYYRRWGVRVRPQVAERVKPFRKSRKISGNPRKCLGLKGSTQLDTWNKNLKIPKVTIKSRRCSSK